MDKATDIEFLKLASVHLDRFHRTGGDVYNFRCPFCGDSQKSKTKARAYVYPKGNHMIFTCHNCGEPANMHKLLQRVDPALANQYSLKSFVNGGIRKSKSHDFSYTPTIQILDEIQPDMNVPSIAELKNDHPAKVHLLQNRKLPEHRLNDLYYTEDFAKYIKEIAPHVDKELMENDARIIIPLRNKSGTLIGVQGNTIHNDGQRYITIQMIEETLFWNRDNIDENQPTLVFEGAYDAMFFDNAIATLSNSSMQKADMENKILVFDNEPMNPHTVRFMENAARNGLTLCVWGPPFNHQKDVNDMIKSGFSADQVYDFIIKNSYNGLRLTLEINEWKKRK